MPPSGAGVHTKATRFFCSARFYVEDDLVNAFPTIMSQVFKRAGLKTPFLDDYVTKREELFRILGSPALTRDALKSLFLTVATIGARRGASFRFQSSSRVSCRIKVLADKQNNPLGSAVGLVSQLNESKIQLNESKIMSQNLVY